MVPTNESKNLVVIMIVSNSDPFPGLLYCQPLETLTQAILQQCVAVATAPWMSGEVRLADLRIGDTLTHNLVGVSHRLEAVLDGRDAAAAIEITAALPKEERRTEIINLVSGCFVILTRGQWSYSGFFRGPG